MPNYLPISMNGVKAQSGSQTYPEGFYILEVTDAKERRAIKSGDYERQMYKCKIHMGPNWSQEYSGRKLTDAIPITQEWAPRHKELLVACFGSEAAADQVVAQHGGNYAPEITEGRFYIAQVTVNGGFNNVIQRIPYSQEAWNSQVGASPAGGQSAIMQPTQQMAAPMSAPVMPQAQAPQMQQPMMAPPMPQMQQQPMMPGNNNPMPSAVGFSAPPPPPGLPGR